MTKMTRKMEAQSYQLALAIRTLIDDAKKTSAFSSEQWDAIEDDVFELAPYSSSAARFVAELEEHVDNGVAMRVARNYRAINGRRAA